MATNAERQRAYRQRHLKDLDGTKSRINLIVSLSTKCQLERLARDSGLTQVAVLEQLLETADTARVDKLARHPDPAVLREYFDGVTE